MSGSFSPASRRLREATSASCMPMARSAAASASAAFHHHDAALVGDDDVARIHRDAAAAHRHAEFAGEADALGGDGGKAAAPQRHLVLAHFADVGGDAVDDHAGEAGDLARVGDQAAERGVAMVAATVDHQHVARPHLAERIADDGAVHAGRAHRHRRAGDAHVGLHRADAGIHEAPVAEMTDGRRLGPYELGNELRIKRGRQRLEVEHPAAKLSQLVYALFLGRLGRRVAAVLLIRSLLHLRLDRLVRRLGLLGFPGSVHAPERASSIP